MGRRELGLVVVAIAVGGVVASFPIGARILDQPQARADAALLFAALLMTSIAEVMVFTGVLFALTEMLLTADVRLRRLAAPLALVVSATAFGLYHFTYPAPWDRWETVRTVTIVWVVVTAFFVTTRSLPATMVFNNFMAVIGFVLRDLPPPVAAGRGVVLAFVSFSSLVAISGRSRRVQSTRTADLPG